MWLYVFLAVIVLIGVLIGVFIFLVLTGMAANQNKLTEKMERLEVRVSAIEIDRELHGETEDTMQLAQAMSKLPAKIRES